MIELTMLGAGGSMPMPNRYLSSAIIDIKGRKILLDCGEGTQVAMRAQRTGFKRIDVICITHLHGDHLFGLPGLLSTIGNSDRQDPITIIGPTGIKHAVNSMCATILPLPYALYIIENPQQDFAFLELAIIKTLEVDHTTSCLSYVIDIKRQPKFDVNKALANNVPKQLWSQLQKQSDSITFEDITYDPAQVLGDERQGIKISFVTDTRPTDALVPFIKNSDLLICEGTYGMSEEIEKAIKNKHLTFQEAATLAKDATVTQLLLTHFGSAMSEPSLYHANATAVFLNTVLATDGYKQTLTFKEV